MTDPEALSEAELTVLACVEAADPPIENAGQAAALSRLPLPEGRAAIERLVALKLIEMAPGSREAATRVPPHFEVTRGGREFLLR